MSFYIMSDDGQLIECQDERPSEDDLRELAYECECNLWVINGEHAGITYERPDEDDRDQFGSATSEDVPL